MARAARPVVRPLRRLSRALRRPRLWLAPLVIAVGSALLLGGAASERTWPAGTIPGALAVTEALGLVVTDIEVEGRHTTDRATILAALNARAGTPILAVSPTAAKQKLETLPWVRSAAIERRLPGTLYVRLVERKPLAVWQHDGRQQLIDFDGTVIPVTDLSRFAKLPTVVGDDTARQGAAELIAMLDRQPELAPRVTAAVLVGERRWNLRIDNTIDVLLPEDDPAGAWTRLAQLQRDKHLLQRDVRTIDMRLPDRLVLKVNEPGPAKDAPGKKSHQAGKST